MILKPDKCKPCILNKDSGDYYTPDELVDGSEVMIIGQGPGKDEIEDGKPFVGTTGQKLENEFFPIAQLERGKVSLGNSFRCRYRGTNELPPFNVLNAAIHHCTQSYLQIPESIKLIVLQGATAFRRIGEAYKLTDIDDDTGKVKQATIENWRGHLLPWKVHNRDALVTLHIADLLPNRNPKMKHSTLSDFSKIPRYLKGEWPKPLPDRP